MSLILLSRPIGHRLNITDIDAQIIDDGTGDALVYTTIAHGLSDGDYVYIESNLDSYNGFKYVDQIAYDSFKIKNSEDGDFVEFVQGADISYRASVLNHGWQAVHTPIVYELESDLWPNNVAEEAYNPNTIVSQADSNGNTLLNLINAISPTPVELNFIELVGTGDLAGPYQILEVINPWQIVINLAYDAANSFTGYQVVNYYNNYAINVNVWAGLDSGHRWAANKPYELAATLKFIPDSEGKIKFSISDILKGYITTRNNLTLDTLPNNLDFHVSFYIAYFESYDQSDGTDITTFEGETTTDTFEGHAVNSMMPFKSLNMGHMSDYVNEDTFLARWLTLFDRPMAVVDRFFDISFLNQYNGFNIKIMKNGVLFQTITNPGLGVLRVGFIPETGETEICLQAIVDGSVDTTAPALSSGSNESPGTADWTINSAPTVSPGGALIASKRLAYTFAFIPGLDYTFSFNFTTDGGVNFVFLVLDGSGNILVTDNNIIGGASTVTRTATFTSTTQMQKFAFTVSGNITVTLNSVSASVVANDITITEQICIDIISECTGTFVNDQLRLLETGRFRRLE